MKYVAAGGLGALAGFFAGAYLAPLPLSNHGLPTLAAMILGGLIGSGIGAIAGAAVARFLPDLK